MADPTVTLESIEKTAGQVVGRAAPLGLLAALLLVASWFAPKIAGTVLLTAGLTTGFLCALVFILANSAKRRKNIGDTLIQKFVGHDKSASFVTDKDGTITFRNETAAERYGEEPDKSLAYLFRDRFANPSALIFRLQNRAQALGGAQEDIATRRGHLRFSVHQIGGAEFLWRIEEFGDQNSKSRGADGISLPMLTVSGTGTILFMNEAMRTLLGGRVKTLDRVFGTLPVVSGEFAEINGRDGPITSLVAEVEDIAGRKEIYLIPGMAKSLQNGATMPVFDDLPVPLLKIGSDGKLRDANRLARDLLADPVAPDTALADLVEGLGRSVADWLQDAFQGRGLKRTEIIRARKPEPDVFLQIALNLQLDGDEPVLVAVLTDATELKTLEAQFVQSQKMQAIGQLAGGVAHDFNNLLTAITGHCDLLLLRHDECDADFADLVQINENANRAASLVGQLLAFSRKQNLQPEVIDLRDSLSDLTHLLNRLVGERVSLSLSHDPDLGSIRVDGRQLEQVVMNLVVNARDAMQGGGVIRIETQAKTLSQPLRRDRVEVPAGDYVVVRVVDEGHGIAPDKLSKIFEPFYTTKRTGEGTGLGLSMAYGIIKQSGGYIFVDSAVGAGTTFSLFFPKFDGQADEEIPDLPVAMQKEVLPEPGDAVVLLVEDEAPVRAFASRALRLRGYTVIEADCAEDALETLKDENLEVDLFVTDVMMPGMDGPSWVKQALQARPNVKVIFVSGYAEDAFGSSPDVIPNSVFLPKPFSLVDLTNTVQQQLH